MRGRAGRRRRSRTPRPSPRPARGACVSYGVERGEARVHRVLDGEGELDGRELVEVDAPRGPLAELAHLLEHALVVVDAHHLLEEQRVAAGEGAAPTSTSCRGRPALARREERLHHRRPRPRRASGPSSSDACGAARRRAPSPPGARAARGGAAQRTQDRARQVLEQVAEQRERVVVRLRADPRRRGRSASASASASRKALKTARRMMRGLLRVVADRAGERALVAADAEELAEEVDDVADLAIVEDRRDLRADLGPRGVLRPSPRRARSARGGAWRRAPNAVTVSRGAAAVDARHEPASRPLRAPRALALARPARCRARGGGG